MAKWTPRRGRAIEPEERERILRMAEDGVPYREIAETLERPRGTISSVISDGILAGTVTRRRTREDTRKG